MSDKKKIFLSHKGKDKQLVRDFKKTLETIGYEPWLDEDAMPAGTSLERGILQGMKDSCAVVFFITPSFKDEGYLESEINYAIQEKRNKKDKFSIITLQFVDDSGEKGSIPELLKPYVWKTPKNSLEALREIIRSLPIIPSNFAWRKEVENVLIEPGFQSNDIQLSEEAQQILRKASTDPDGMIFKVTYFEGKDIQTNRESLIPDDNVRTIAKWEDALTELINSQYIRQTDRQGKIFRVTSKGYDIADELKKFEFIKSPYRSGNLIQELEQGNTKMFFGRDETIQQLKQILIDHDDSLVILYGQRRTGKSCLMKYIQKRKIFEPNLTVIFLDMQGLSSEQRFYESVLSQIQAITRVSQKINIYVNEFDDFADSLNTLLQGVSTGILIMIDELESITNKHFKYTSISDGYEFLQRIRSLIQHTPLVKFVLAGTDGLRAMINDYHNPLFKAGRTLHIAFLHSQDARNLIIKPLADTVSYTDDAITLIQDATFNHPYFIQCICQRLIDILNEDERYFITNTDVQQAIDDLQKTETDMFEYVWEITDQIEHITLSIIAQEIKGRTWISIDQIEKTLANNNYQIKEYILDTSIKTLIQKDIVLESNSGLEYTIPIGLLRTWLQIHKPLSRVRREVSAYQRESLPS
ncbi:MAG: TIR domain-containing protein [Xenococcus sp. (in: cyanobacteria)]